ncbi:MAG TPA: PEP-CTERM sorting domain-containing protein [Quisquiliibacterium sp.]|nr:PEP-CTERM sorting domain-containing protein [Quisquiliibacterium sp.]HPA91661.1 PEP-CTERM sorting domain-containing protein [Quisquiliibacterium sp.]HQD84023.1 PEP-CTERM sorting domain-containing protein [Quisquiliibacterium sp.]HQN12049.1 PEP-CTERM sorting domain-containing protein [Quisquiliibacterium sp.]HQP66546.1 PEP-CTERM sorting domain-containing protein [Quisquiliibacterium sp.]
MQHLYAKLSAAALTMFTTSVAFAGTAPVNHVPEPGVLELAGLGLAVAIAVTLRKRK